MSLLSGYNVLSRSPGRRMGGTTQSGDRANFSKTGAARNRYQVFARFNATPTGYLPPYAWVLPQISGGMASFTRLESSSSLTGSISGGRNIDADLAATFAITNANLGLVVAMSADIAATFGITGAPLAGVVEMAAALSSSYSLTATMGALVSATANLTLSVSFSGTASAIGYMEADILPYTELSPESLARAVWSSDITAYDDSGTAGKKLNDVSVGGSAWDALIEGGHDAGGILRILLAHATGNATLPDGDGAYEFLAADGVTPRITGAISGATRTVSDVDGTE